MRIYFKIINKLKKKDNSLLLSYIFNNFHTFKQSNISEVLIGFKGRKPLNFVYL